MSNTPDLCLWGLLTDCIVISDLCEVVLKYAGISLMFIKRQYLLRAHIPPDICRIVLDYTSGILGKRGRMTKFADGPVYAMAVSSEGLIIVGGWTGPIVVWNSETQTIIRTLYGHTSGTVALLIMASGCLVSVSSDLTMRVWNYMGGECSHVINLFAIPFSLTEWEGKVIVGYSDGKVRVWDVGGTRLLTLTGHIASVTSVAVRRGLLASCPSLLASSSVDGKIRVWSIENGEQVKGTPLGILEGHASRVNGVAWRPDGMLVSCSADRTIRIWDINSGTCVHVVYGHTEEVKCIAMLGELLVSASSHGIVRVHADDGTQLHAMDQGRAVCGLVTCLEAIYILNHSNEIQEIL